jgi:prepilin-type N-terminal cleavage/methylation domain-containing protein
MGTTHRSSQSGFTLIEIIVVMAILGVLAAILVPSVTGLLGKGDVAALEGDQTAVALAVDEFKLDRHKGPNGTPEWGAGSNCRCYPTEDGETGHLELSTSIEDPAVSGNFRIDAYAAGSTTGGTATDDDIVDSLIWIGLLVNEPFTASGAALQETGSAHPQGGEDGQYLPSFPTTAHASNTVDQTGTASFTSGSYHYVLLQNGRTVIAYKSGGAWYNGYNNVFP